MNDRTRGKRCPPKGLPFKSDTKKLGDRKLVNTTEVFSPGQESENSAAIAPTTTLQGSYMISRAYSEPQGFDMVENIMLQRDYIID